MGDFPLSGTWVVGACGISGLGEGIGFGLHSYGSGLGGGVWYIRDGEINGQTSPP
ncbi:hypothetical protein ACLOJK_038845 [Asimina triloba]